MAVNQLSESIVIAADPEAVYDVVSDVTRTGEWSPVCRECWWEDGGQDGTGPVAGAWFGGRQKVPGRTWETRSLVLEADRGRAFTWQVGGRFVTWGYLLRPVDGGTELTETWQLNEATEVLFAEKYADRADDVLDQRRQEARSGIPATLAALKQIIESGTPGNPPRG